MQPMFVCELAAPTAALGVFEVPEFEMAVCEHAIGIFCFLCLRTVG